MSHAASEKSKAGHRWGMTITGLVLLGASLAAAFVAFGPGRADLPGWLYRLAPSSKRAPAAPVLVRRPPIVVWRDWGAEAFAEAKRSDRLILLNIGASWCSACRDMQATTYASEEIAAWIAGNVVAVRVDGDLRPDLVQRYGAGGWPSTDLLLPTGELISAGTYIPEAAFLPWARQAVEGWQKGRASLLSRKDEARDAARRERTLRALRPQPGWAEVEASVERVYESLLDRWDREHGGFDGPNKFPLSEPVRLLAALRSSKSKDPRLQLVLDSTLKGQARLQDPVAGGFFRYSTEADWSAPRYEKPLKLQADMVQDYLTAYAVTGDLAWRREAEKTLAYIEGTLESPRGGFFASQAADLYVSGDFKMDGAEYYKLGADARRDQGVPDVDRRMFAEANAEAVAAYLQAGSNLQRPDLTAKALKALDLYLKKGVSSKGEAAHMLGDKSVSGLLCDQAALARACVLAFRESGKGVYLQMAVNLLEWARIHLSGEGGMLGSQPEKGAPEPVLDPAGTLRAAEVWLMLDDHTGDAHVPARLKPLWAWCSANSDLLDPAAYARLAQKMLQRQS